MKTFKSYLTEEKDLLCPLTEPGHPVILNFSEILDLEPAIKAAIKKGAIEFQWTGSQYNKIVNVKTDIQSYNGKYRRFELHDKFLFSDAGVYMFFKSAIHEKHFSIRLPGSPTPASFFIKSNNKFYRCFYYFKQENYVIIEITFDEITKNVNLTSTNLDEFYDYQQQYEDAKQHGKKIAARSFPVLTSWVLFQ